MDPRPDTPSDDRLPASKSSGTLTLLIVSWLVVGAPAVWGVSRTVQTALKLFDAKPAAAATTPKPAGPATTP